MNPSGRPPRNCYWVIPGRFLAGAYPGGDSEYEARERVGWLLGAGIDFFLDLTAAGELRPYEACLQELAGGDSAAYRRMSIGDFQTPEPFQMAAILDTIDAALAAGRTLYLHCWAGSGRTGTVVGCYLVRQGMPGEAALAEIGRLRGGIPNARPSPETEEQRDLVRHWPAGPERKDSSG